MKHPGITRWDYLKLKSLSVDDQHDQPPNFVKVKLKIAPGYMATNRRPADGRELHIV